MQLIRLTAKQYYSRFWENIILEEEEIPGKKEMGASAAPPLLPPDAIIYGAGHDGRKLLQELREWNIPVKYFCDRDPGLSGSIIDGIEVIPPSALQGKEREVHLFLSINNPEYSRQSVLEYISSFSIKCRVFKILSEGVIMDGEWDSNLEHWFYPLCFDRVENFNWDYLHEVYKECPSVRMKNGILGFDDCEGKYYNIKDNVRRTCGAPAVCDNRIYMIGDSRVRGGMNEDRFTIASFLQNRLNRQPPDKTYQVVNRGRVQYLIWTFYEELKSLPLMPGDFVLFCNTLYLQSFAQDCYSCTPKQAAEIYAYYLCQMNAYCRERQAAFLFFSIPSVSEIENPSLVEKYIADIHFEPVENNCSDPMPSRAQKLDKEVLFELLNFKAVPFLDFRHYFKRPHHFGEVYMAPTHLSPNGYKAVADKLYDFLFYSRNAGVDMNLVSEYEKRCETGLSKTVESTCQSDELDAYLHYISQYKSEFSNNGALVMNCNPFTNGHRYLTEYAASRVDTLYLFVLQEEKSQFAFADRFALVREGVKDLKNVVVLKGGGFIISSLTLPEYFNKENSSQSVLNCADDIILFATKVAPVLQITKRFVGEEPYCDITRQYNRQMERLLPRYGVEFIEIPRLEYDNRAISASEVRRLFAKRDFEQIRRLVPPTTFAFLENEMEDRSL